jgi:hypothetical protein
MELWTRSIRHMLHFGRYPALIVSMHFTALRKRQALYNSSDGQDREREFLGQQARFQKELSDSLRACKTYARFVSPDLLERNSRLLAVWDWLSLVVLMGGPKPQLIPDVPASRGAVELEVQPLGSSPTQFAIAPWPFRSESVELRCEGRMLPLRLSSAENLEQAYHEAPHVALSILLVPRG